MKSFAEIGTPKILNENLLPTYKEVLNHIIFVKTNGSKNPIELCADRVQSIWNKTGIPIVSRARIIQLLRSYYSLFLNLKNSPFRVNPSEQYKQKKQKLLRKCTHLFDICACKCEDIANCACTEERKIKQVDAEFLIDQRTTRMLMISKHINFSN